MSEYTKGKLHRHGLSIHIERSESGEVVEHTCIADGNDNRGHLPDEANIEHILTCWNSYDALIKIKELAYEVVCTGDQQASDKLISLIENYETDIATAGKE